MTYSARHQSVSAWLTAQPAEALLVTDPTNLLWLTGFTGSFGLGLLLRSGACHLFTDSRYFDAVQGDLRACGVTPHLWPKPDESFPVDFPSSLLVENTLSLARFDVLKARFGATTFISTPGPFSSLRRQKTTQEVHHITHAQSHVNTLLTPFLRQHARLGVSEATLAFQLELALRHEGAYGLSFDPIVAFGENAANPHHTPSSQRRLTHGDVILIDCGVTHQHYASDVTRCFTFGPPSQMVLDAYHALLSAQVSTLHQVRPGIATADLAHHCRTQLGTRATHFTHSLGHGVGLNVHEAPTLSTRSQDTLQAHDVITIEPGLYFPGQFGFRVEDLVVVTQNGPQVLSTTPKHLLDLSTGAILVPDVG